MSHLPPAPRMLAVLAAGAALTMLAACGGGSGGGSTQGSGSPSPASSSGSAPATPAPKKAPKPPGLVAVTKAGALVLLGSRHGQVIRTLVAGGVRGDEISVSPDHSTVYFSVRHGCLGQIESVPVAGGSPTVIADGTVPAISPDGTRLAYATAPLQTGACVPDASELTKQYTLVIRTLSTGTQAVYPQLPAGQDTGLPAPISHLSWSPDGGTLAVSIASVQDNEGWNLILLNPATARDYLTGAGDQSVPAGDPQGSYWREGVYTAEREPVRQPGLLQRFPGAQQVPADVGSQPGRRDAAPGRHRVRQPGAHQPVGQRQRLLAAVPGRRHPVHLA